MLQPVQAFTSNYLRILLLSVASIGASFHHKDLIAQDILKEASDRLMSYLLLTIGFQKNF